jgi:hypothetical protein
VTHILRLPVTDETYKALTALAAKYNLSREALLEGWLKEKLEEEQEAAKYDAEFHNDPEWAEGARKALEQPSAGQGKVYHSSEEFLQALDAIRCERGDSDANV